jgi:hypothetical protein
VKEVISENEGLHEREKAGLLKSVFDCVETGDEDDQELESEGKVGARTTSLRTVVARTNTGKDFFLDFPIYLQSVYIHLNTISKLCVEKRGQVEESSVAPLCDKRVKTLCGCQGKKGTN